MYNNADTDLIKKLVSNLDESHIIKGQILQILQNLEKRISILESEYKNIEHRVCDDDLK